MRAKKKARYFLYGYGIVDNHGQSFWSENCVCQDRAPMEDLAAELNDEERAHGRPDRFRAVALYRRSAR